MYVMYVYFLLSRGGGVARTLSISKNADLPFQTRFNTSVQEPLVALGVPQPHGPLRVVAGLACAGVLLPWEPGLDTTHVVHVVPPAVPVGARAACFRHARGHPTGSAAAAGRWGIAHELGGEPSRPCANGGRRAVVLRERTLRGACIRALTAFATPPVRSATMPVCTAHMPIRRAAHPRECGHVWFVVYY